MPNEIEKSFVKSFINFLKKQIQQLNADAAESTEVAVQCLEAAYDIHTESDSANDCAGGSGGGANEQYEHNPLDNIDLFDLFQTATVSVTPERKGQAEEVKNEGNRLMKEAKYNEALLQYNRAISLDATNPVFYCNRAAAYIRLNEFDKAISDCRMSLLYNPNYSKAHGRMGIAYSNLQKYEEARQAYKRALELEPENQDYQNNLRVCEERLQQSSQRLGQQFLQNLPIDSQDLRNLISDMLNDPMISAASRQLVVQMANEYPDFISGFRQQLLNFTSAGSRNGVGGGNSQQQNPTQHANDKPGASSSDATASQQQDQVQSNRDNRSSSGVSQLNQNNFGIGNISGRSTVDGSNSGGDELNVNEREDHAPDAAHRRPLHLRQPPQRPGPEELIQQIAAAAGAAPHFEEVPPSDGPNIHSVPAQQGHTPRSDGGGDDHSE